MQREILEGVIAALKAGRVPALSTRDFPRFAGSCQGGDPHATPEALAAIAKSLTAADIPTLERALKAVEAHEQAWLGFKVVYDPAAAQTNETVGFSRSYDQGSADGEPLVFFCSEAKEVVASRAYSDRDYFQMKDVTRGPAMHTDQFPGLVWVAEPLFSQVHVWLLGASDVAVETAALAQHVDFRVTVVDYDPAYLSPERFPQAERVLLHGGTFSELANMPADPQDYVCVLTRGHMYDPEACVWALENGAHYVGMLGCAGKNEGVRQKVLEAGVDPADWERVKRPIGLKFGAKTPAELALAIVAELVDTRYRQRFTPEQQAHHEKNLGRP